MKLRTKLFLWFGGLFFLFFAGTLILENILVKKKLVKAENALYEEIYQLSRQRRKHLEEFLGIVIADIQAKVDALLYRIGNYSFYKYPFLPEQDEMVWNAASDTLLRNKWVDFIQSQVGRNFTAEILPANVRLKEADEYIIDEDLIWISSDKKLYIGIFLPLHLLAKMGNVRGMNDEKIGPEVHIAFDPKRLMRMSIPDRSKTPMEREYWEKIKKAKKVVLDNERALKKGNTRQFLKAYRKKPITKKNALSPKQFIDTKTLPSSLIGKEFTHSFMSDLERTHILLLGSAITKMASHGFWNGDPLGMLAPDAIVSKMPYETKGSLLLLYELFFQKALFDAPVYFDMMGKKSMPIPIASSIAIILGPRNDLFLGNSLYLKNENTKVGYLTVGENITSLMQKLALSSDEVALLSHDDKVISVFNPNGLKDKDSPYYDIPIAEMQKKDMGIINFNGMEYFYLHLQPYREADLHFFTIETKKKAFHLIDALHEETMRMISNISWDMRISAFIALIIALLFLENIARKITKPIDSLASVAAHVKEGKFDVELPKVEKGQSNEVASLINSFTEMVKGLEEREKVRGVLNKVVSKDIASEILKGSVHLGGEERDVTIFFADIRNFTKLTEKMAPTQVIEMLNACMTKITKVIDENGGVIDKYVGDEAMALFGAPVAHKDASLRSIVSAVRIQKVLSEWNAERKGNNEQLVEMGIGINGGSVLAGNMGAENRLNYTVLGYHVNLSARLCEAAKPNEVLITESVLNAYRVRDMIEVQEMDAMSFKGLSEPVKIFRVIKLKTEDITYE